MAQQTGQQTPGGPNDKSRSSTQERAPEAQGRQQSQAGGESKQPETATEQRAAGSAVERQGGTQMSRRPTPSPRNLPTPFSLVRRMMEDMDRIFGEVDFGSPLSPFAGVGFERRVPQLQAWSPQIEVAEQDGRIVVRADMPGLTADDIQIALEGDTVVVSGERREEQREQRGNVSYTERSYGAFSRAITVPEGVSENDIEASFSNGVLELVINAPQHRARERRIPIRAGQ